MYRAWKSLITGEEIRDPTPSDRSIYQSRSQDNQHEVELGSQTSTNRFSQFTFFPASDADSITKSQTEPHYVT
jgi:hypothetical protein